MKRSLSFIILGLMFLLSCDKYNIQLDKNYVEMDFRAQKFVIYADRKITGIEFDLTEEYDLKREEHRKEYCVEGTHWRTECGWIKADIDYSDPYHFTVTLDENASSKNRKALVYADRLAGSDTLLVMQKGCPVPRE